MKVSAKNDLRRWKKYEYLKTIETNGPTTLGKGAYVDFNKFTALRLQILRKRLSFYKISSDLEFRDHHNFSNRDAGKIKRWALKHNKALIITTEKDAQRLSALTQLPDEVKSRMFYLPVEAVLLRSR
ncbi:hypothetical protein MASR1M46_19670 [Bacteroidales bacterium]